jgi:hypothetical protein
MNTLLATRLYDTSATRSTKKSLDTFLCHDSQAIILEKIRQWLEPTRIIFLEGLHLLSQLIPVSLHTNTSSYVS